MVRNVLVYGDVVLWWLVSAFLKQCVDVVAWAAVMGIVCFLWHCVVLKCVVCNGMDCYCMVVVLEWVFFLICCLAGAGGVGKRGVFQVGCRHVYDGTVLCTGFWQFAAAGFRLFVLLMTFHHLGGSVEHVFEHLGHCVGGILTVSSILWGGLKVDIGVHW